MLDPYEEERCGCGLALAVGAGLVEGLEELLGADDLAIESAGDQGVPLNHAFLCTGDGDAVDFEGAAESALVLALASESLAKARSSVP